MAVWQYTFQVLPRESVNTFLEGFYFIHKDEVFDDELYWKNFPIKKTFFSKINSILKKNKSWSNEIDLYGNQESNCFEILSDSDDYVLSVSFRIDFTSTYEPLLRDIVEFCSLKGLVILDERLNVVSLNYEQIQSIITNSPQMKRYNELYKTDNSK